MLTTQLFLL